MGRCDLCGKSDPTNKHLIQWSTLKARGDYARVHAHTAAPGYLSTSLGLDLTDTTTICEGCQRKLASQTAFAASVLQHRGRTTRRQVVPLVQARAVADDTTVRVVRGSAEFVVSPAFEPVVLALAGEEPGDIVAALREAYRLAPIDVQNALDGCFLTKLAAEAKRACRAKKGLRGRFYTAAAATFLDVPKRASGPYLLTRRPGGVPLAITARPCNVLENLLYENKKSRLYH